MGNVLSLELPLTTRYHQLRQHTQSHTHSPSSHTSASAHARQFARKSAPPPHANAPNPILASLPSHTLREYGGRSEGEPLPSPLRLFGQLLPKLWGLWECMVLSEPIVLFAKSPRDASLAVWWLMELVKPVRILLFLSRYRVLGLRSDLFNLQ